MPGYQIWESVGGNSQRVRNYADIERHHPSSGNERGRIYATINGEREEVMGNYAGTPEVSRSGSFYVSKDFVLQSNGSSNVPVPAVANGYIGNIDPRNGIVEIYDKPATDPSREMIAKYRHMDLRATGLEVGQHVEYGQPLAPQGGFNQGNPHAFGTHTHIDINDKYLGQMDRYLRDIDSGVIGTDKRPQNVENQTSPATVSNVSSRERIVLNPSGGATRTTTGNGQTQRSGNAIADGMLEQGEKGADVKGLQQSLNKLGIKDASGNRLTEDSDFGKHTKEAVENFQRANGLKVDGIAGEKTLTAIGNKLPDGKVTVDASGVTGPDAKIVPPTTPTTDKPLISDAKHPNHALFEAVSGKLPAGTKPEVAANVTLQAMENGITGVDKLGRVDVRGNDVFVQGVLAGDKAKVDLQAPTPTLQQMSDHMAGQTQQTQAVEEQQQQQRQKPSTTMMA